MNTWQKPPLGELPEVGAFPMPVGLWLMNDGSGSKIFDVSGNGLIGTINGATWIPGGLRFDGNDYIPLTSSLIKTANITVIARIKVNDFVSTIGAGVVASVSSSAGWRLITTTANFNAFRFTINAYNANEAYETNLEIGKTYMVAGRYDGINVQVFVDGAAGIPVADAGPISYGTDFEIGRFNGNDAYALESDIEWVMIFDYALTDSQIQQFYINPFPWFRRDDILLWTAAMAGAPPGVTIPLMYHHYTKNIGA